jgi:hypothetical protein
MTDTAREALETAAARFNMMAGVGLVNGVDPKVGYRECMEALASLPQSEPVKPFGYYFWKSNGDGTESPDFCKGEIPRYVRVVRGVTPLHTTPQQPASPDASAETRLNTCREKLSALRETERQKMNTAADRAEAAASAGDMTEVSISSTESERHRQAFSVLNVAISEFDKLYSTLSQPAGDETTKSEGDETIEYVKFKGSAVDALDARKESDDGPTEEQVTADARRFLNPAPDVLAMREALGEIANRASNFADDDAAEWMPSIYKISCEAIGEDPKPSLKAAGFDGLPDTWPTRQALTAAPSLPSVEEIARIERVISLMKIANTQKTPMSIWDSDIKAVTAILDLIRAKIGVCDENKASPQQQRNTPNQAWKDNGSSAAHGT